MHIHWESEPYTAEHINSQIALLRAQSDGRVVGVQVWGVDLVDRIGEG
jgi:hypothetical protein